MIFVQLMYSVEISIYQEAVSIDARELSVDPTIGCYPALVNLE